MEVDGAGTPMAHGLVITGTSNMAVAILEFGRTTQVEKFFNVVNQMLRMCSFALHEQYI